MQSCIAHPTSGTWQITSLFLMEAAPVSMSALPGRMAPARRCSGLRRRPKRKRGSWRISVYQRCMIGLTYPPIVLLPGTEAGRPYTGWAVRCLRIRFSLSRQRRHVTVDAGGSAQAEAGPGSVAQSAMRQCGVTAWYRGDRPARSAGPSLRSATKTRPASMIMTLSCRSWRANSGAGTYTK